MQLVTQNKITLCCDYVSGRYFESTIADIKDIVNKTNEKLMLNYDRVRKHVPKDAEELLSEELGFKTEFYNIVCEYCNFSLWGRIDSELEAVILEDGRPCIVVYWVYFYS